MLACPFEDSHFVRKRGTHLLVFPARDLLQEIWDALPLGDVEAEAAEEVHDLLSRAVVQDVPCRNMV